ncbi:MAG TPA: cation:proton antiporter [Treponemataceae bacterium]|nr:cation:proton antiporter [Treponemataceae bacterium]
MQFEFNVIFAFILAGGWFSGILFKKISLPPILGMVVCGIAFSLFLKPHTPSIVWEISPYLKSFALIVILLRAGLGLQRAALKKVGRIALLMAFVPCVVEGTALTVMFHFFFDFNYAVAGLTGFMLAAVSPAVIVPSMLDLKDRAKGKKNEVPTIILAGASADDVFAITIFSAFLSLAQPEFGAATFNILTSILSVPFSIVIGILSGLILGFLLAYVFKRHYVTIRATEKTLIILVASMFLVQVGDSLHFAALLGLMTVGFILLERQEKVAHELSEKLAKIWVFAEIILFVIIGFSLDIPTALGAGLKGLAIIAVGLLFRSLGVYIATAGSNLTFKERIFCMIAYIPKATVQAALGGVALSHGIPEGNTILAIAVVSILFTAPLGLIGIRYFSNVLLSD